MELTTLWTIATWLDFTSYIAHLIHNIYYNDGSYVSILFGVLRPYRNDFCTDC